jgi:hypothetical protein
VLKIKVIATIGINAKGSFQAIKIAEGNNTKNPKILINLGCVGFFIDNLF